ncbi:MAG: GNAT family N-acetyltransferase [Paracoccaceae bacterium]
MPLIRPAMRQDRAAIEALLLTHIPTAMFPLTNLRNHGLADAAFPSAHPHAMRLWLIGDEPTCLIGLTRAGMLMPLLPDPHADLSTLPAALAGHPISGAIGPAPDTRRALAALNLTTKPTRRDEDEPGFTLDLARLHIPPIPRATLIAPTTAHIPLLIAWRTTYQIETLGTPPDEATTRATADIDAYLARDSHRILMLDDQPVAMTGFNATLPEIVQIGGVFTPAPFRARGYARLAVALHLAEAAAKGVTRAVLFAASDAAVRAYTAIGFQPAQPMALILFDGPQTVPPCP